MVTEQDIRTAYEALLDATAAHNRAAMTAVTAKRKLEEERADAISRGLITGKNAEEREACSRTICAAAHKWAAEADESERVARCELEFAKIEVDMLRLLVRLLELDGVGFAGETL